MSQAGLKAGLIGGAIIAVLQLVGLIPNIFLSCCTCLVILAACVGTGVLAAYWLPIPRSAGDGAGAGAIAGVVAGIIAGIFGMIITALQFVIFGGTAGVLARMPPEFFDAMRDAGMDPNTFGGAASIGGVIGASALCCIVGMVFAAVLGAIGGAILAAMQSE